MREDEAWLLCEESGCHLLEYQEAVKADFLLPDGRSVGITIGIEVANLYRAWRFLGLKIGKKKIKTWTLFDLHTECHYNVRPPRHLINLIVFDVLIKRLARCRSVSDVATRVATGELDPLAETRRWLDDPACRM